MTIIGTCPDCGCQMSLHKPDSVHDILWCTRCGSSSCRTQTTGVRQAPRVVPDVIPALVTPPWLSSLLGRAVKRIVA